MPTWKLSSSQRQLPNCRQPGRYPETLVLYRMRPVVGWQVDSGRRVGRVRYSCLKEAAGEEAPMQIEWCWNDEKGFGKRE
jgi:hypothetical protein